MDLPEHYCNICKLLLDRNEPDLNLIHHLTNRLEVYNKQDLQNIKDYWLQEKKKQQAPFQIDKILVTYAFFERIKKMKEDDQLSGYFKKLSSLGVPIEQTDSIASEFMLQVTLTETGKPVLLKPQHIEAFFLKYARKDNN